MKELEKLLKENSGLLSRMKERDGNEKLNKICEEIFKKDFKTMARNQYKKETFEDKFARNYYCTHARLNSIRRDKKEQHKSFRRNFKKTLDKYLNE